MKEIDPENGRLGSRLISRIENKIANCQSARLAAAVLTVKGMVAGRPAAAAVAIALEQRLGRLKERTSGCFYLCVIDFQTPAGRLMFTA
jgi:hypothetical protein